MDFFTHFTQEKTPQNNFSSPNFSVENNYYIVSCKNLVTTNHFFGICLKSFDIYKGKQKLCTVRLNSKINVLINLFVKVCKLIISLILQLVYMIHQVANLPQTQIVNIHISICNTFLSLCIAT